MDKLIELQAAEERLKQAKIGLVRAATELQKALEQSGAMSSARAIKQLELIHAIVEAVK